MIDAAIGFRTRTGRAIGVVLSDDGFVLRREIHLDDPKIPDTAQPYHSVMELPWTQSVVAVQPLVAAIERVAHDALAALIAELRTSNFRVRAIGVVGGPERNLAKIGNYHIRAHAAEGTLFRRVIETAAKKLRLRCCGFAEREVPDALGARMQSIARAAGRPWRADERMAANAGWVALTRN